MAHPRTQPRLSIGSDSFKLLIDEVVDYGIVMLDPDGHVLTWNRGAERIEGFEADEVIGQHFSIFYTDEDRAAGKPQARLSQATRDGRSEDEGWRVRKDGSRYWANIVLTALADDDGSIRGFAKITCDLTLRRQSEDSARRLERAEAERVMAEQHARALQTHAVRLQLLAETSRSFADPGMDVTTLFQGLVERAANALGDCAGLLALDEDGTSLEIVAFHDRSADAAVFGREHLIGRKVPAAFGLVAQVLRGRGQEVFVPDASSAGRLSHPDPLVARFLVDFPIESFIATPLHVAGRLRGVVGMARHMAEVRYTPDDLSLLQDLVDRTGMAMRTIQLFGEQVHLRAAAERAADRQGRLQAITAALAQVLTPTEAGRAVMDQALPALKATSGAIYLAKGDSLAYLSSHGISSERLESFHTIPLTSDLPIAVGARDQKPIYLRNRQELASRVSASNLRPGVHAAAILPLKVKAELIGMISLSFSEERDFSEPDQAFLEAICQQCALAIERAIVRDRERVQGDQTAFLSRATQLLAASLDYETVLQNLAGLVVPGFADWCSIDMLEDSQIRRLAVAHVDPAKVEWAWELYRRFPPDPSEPQGVAEVIRSGSPQLFREIPSSVYEQAPPELVEVIDQLGLRSAMTVPIRSRNQSVGAITLVWAETSKNYDDDDLAFAMELARRAGAAVENARLYRELQVAVQVRDDFLAVAGHELRTPLAALLMQVQGLERLARKDGTDAMKVERLRKAAHAGFRLERLVNQVLDVSRLTAGGLHLEPEVVDIGRLVHEAVERTNEEHAVTLVSCETEGGLVGTFDRTRLEQVMTNLLMNAVKYGRGNEVRVTAHRNGDHAVIAVIDRGIGIEPGLQARIFERFGRAVGAEEYGGFGLGLWIARQIVEESGGTIAVVSQPGEGSTFTVQLPLAPS